MSRKSDNVWPALAVLALAIGASLAACQQTPPTLDLATVTPCPGESGPIDGQPCVWDAQRAPAQLREPAYRWVLYAEHCPTTTKQDHRTVRCIARGDWSN